MRTIKDNPVCRSQITYIAGFGGAATNPGTGDQRKDLLKPLLSGLRANEATQQLLTATRARDQPHTKLNQADIALGSGDDTGTMHKQLGSTAQGTASWRT